MSLDYILILVIGVIGMIVQWRLQSVFDRYSRVPFSGGLTGRQVAERMLKDNGIHDVRVTSTPGKLTDHFDPRSKTVNLSEPVYNSNSVAAAAVAAHECGHAVQHAVGYAPIKMRSALVPAITFTSKYSIWVIIAGIAMIRTFPPLFWIGVAMIAMSAVFALVTLPVELNASHRALAWLTESGTLRGDERHGAEVSLRWAASTYIVAAVSAVATLLYYIGFARRR